MKRFVGYFLITSAALLAFVSLLIVPCIDQVRKNQTFLSDMKVRVAAILEFERSNGRLPRNEELKDSLGALSFRGYWINTSPIGDEPGYPKNWPASGGWVLSVWRGEWSEFYTSWDGHYTVAAESTMWGFCGSLLLAPFASIVLFVAGAVCLRSAKAPNKSITDQRAPRVADC